MKKILLGIAVVLLAFSVNAKDKEVKSKSVSDSESTAAVVLTGTISDSGSGELLAGVEVSIEGTDMKTYTDFDGNFTFKVKPGEYKVVTNYISYQKTSEKVNINTKENDVKIKLQSSN